MLPLTLIASIFGMNITFPFQDDTKHFWIVIGAMGFIGLSLFAFFRARRWV
jgi:magnesium transporter